MIRRKKAANKQQIISEYLTGNETFLVLSKKYGVNARTIQSWVRSFRKRHPIKTDEPDGASQEVKALRKQLEEAHLKNELLEEMLRLSEELSGIDLRKKFGSRQ
jgi:transposase-like protein